MGIEVTMDRDPGGYGPDMEGWMDSYCENKGTHYRVPHQTKKNDNK